MLQELPCFFLEEEEEVINLKTSFKIILLEFLIIQNKKQLETGLKLVGIPHGWAKIGAASDL